MDFGVIMWIYKVTTLYLSLWTQKQPGPTRHTLAQTRTLDPNTNITSRVDQCLEQFQNLRTHIEASFYNDRRETMYLYIYRQTYCQLYEDSLQCLHNLLEKHQEDKAIELVQECLGQPWALRTNKLCNINVKDSDKHVPNQLTVSSNNEDITNLRTNTDNLQNSDVQSNKNSEVQSNKNSDVQSKKNSDVQSNKPDTSDSIKPSSSKLFNLLLIKNISMPHRNKSSDSDKTVQQKDMHTSTGVVMLLRKYTSTNNADVKQTVHEFEQVVSKEVTQHKDTSESASNIPDNELYPSQDTIYFHHVSEHS